MISVTVGEGVKEIVIDGSTFKYKVLNGEAEAEIQNRVIKVNQRGKLEWKPGSLMLATLQTGLVGWENVIDEQSKQPVAFDSGLIKYLPRETRQALYECISPNKLDEEEIKNL